MSKLLSAHERAPSADERSLSARLVSMSAHVRSARGLRGASGVRWLVLAASFALSASTWMALSDLTEYPHKINVLMAVTADGYIVVALLTWLYARNPAIAAFAKKNTYGSAIFGIIAQSTYHGYTVYTHTHIVWRTVMAACVGLVPPLFAALSVHLSAILARDLEAERARAASEPVSGEMSAHERSDTLDTELRALTERAVSAHERTTERVSVTERLTERAVIGRERALPLIAERLRAGEALSGAHIAEEYGIHESSGRRWLNDAKALSARVLVDRALTLIQGGDERS
jgi:hypothetical protein